MNHKPETLDALLGDCKTPADVGSLYSQLLQRMINRSLEAEMDVHLGYARHTKADADSARSNRRNGVGTKTVKGEQYGTDHGLWRFGVFRYHIFAAPTDRMCRD